MVQQLELLTDMKNEKEIRSQQEELSTSFNNQDKPQS